MKFSASNGGYMSRSIIYEKPSGDSLGNFIERYTKEHFSETSNVKVYEIDERTIEPCKGCFVCWVVNPGVCVMKDLSKELNDAFIYDDVVLIITKLSFGTYSSTMKTVIDRSVGMMRPYFFKVGGETHHRRRIKQAAKYIMLAYGEDITAEEQEIFTGITKANVLNLGLDKIDLYFARNEEECLQSLQKIEKLFKGGVRSE